MKKEVREILSNCWFDTAAMPFLYRPEALRAFADAIGVEKLLLGTDHPLLPPKRYFREMAQSLLTEKEKNAILGENSYKLLFG